MITTNNIAAFRADLVEALKTLEKKYDLIFEIGPIHYNDAAVSTKLEAKAIVNGEIAINPIHEAQAHNFFLDYGKKPPQKIIGAMVELHDGKQGKILDFSNRRKSNPFLTKIDDEEYWVTLGSIKRFI